MRNKIRRHWIVGLINAMAFVALAMVATGHAMAAAPMRISCVGDSITAGAGVPASTAWPMVLQHLLGKKYNVRDFGVSGTTMLKHSDYTYWGTPQFKQAQAFKPNVVIIMLGTNDTKPWNWKNAKAFPADYKAMVHRFESLPSKPQVFVCLPPPVIRGGNYGINEENLFFGVIPDILRVAKDLHLPVINIHYWMLGQPGLIQGDGVHPNVKGQAFMAKVVAAKLKKVWGTIK